MSKSEKGPIKNRLNAVPNPPVFSSSRGLKKNDTKLNIHTKSTYSKEFHTPEMQSTLKISKDFDQVIKSTNTISLSDANTNTLAADERISRKVNFPYGQSVFKDLIPLCLQQSKSVPLVASRGPVIQKDPEPVLKQFLEIEETENQFYLPNCDKLSYDRFVSVTNPLHLSKILQNSNS